MAHSDEPIVPGAHGNSDDHERKIRLRPRKPKVGSNRQALPYGLRTVLRLARAAKRRINGKRSASGSTKLRVGRRQFNQRCSIRVTYSSNGARGLWAAHGRYIARETATGLDASGFSPSEVGIDVSAKLRQWQSENDERLWKIIISPEFGHRLDLEKLARETLAAMEKDLGTKLEWVAVCHFNTDHPHVHVALRGRGEDGSALRLSPDYVRRGIRSHAEEGCTRQIGYRTDKDAANAEEREIHQARFTSLDRIILANAPADLGNLPQFGVSQKEIPSDDWFTKLRAQHLRARLSALQDMGLATQTDSDTWNVRSDFESVLRAMQRTGDRQKILARHGRMLSDPRLPLHACPKNFREIEGRVLGNGEDDAARHYILIEGTDAKVHFLYYSPEMEAARASGKLKANAFVRLRRRFLNGRPTTEIEDFGDAEKTLSDKSLLAAGAQRCLELRGIPPEEEGWSGWLGRYQSALRHAAQEIEVQTPKKRRDLGRER